MRYRLGRITEISGLDLTDPEVRLVCQLLIDIPFGPNRMD
jgi:DNA-binding PucR family transcriptional regulator